MRETFRCLFPLEQERSVLSRYWHTQYRRDLPVENFNLYIPSGKRKVWDSFRERVDLEGKRVSDVVADLVSDYMAGKSRASGDSDKAGR